MLQVVSTSYSYEWYDIPNNLVGSGSTFTPPTYEWIFNAPS